jgi:inosine-uridine nucleoside N-ribohydrolase
MAGDFAPDGGCEWNARGDPHATAIVYNTEVRFHRSVGKNVTSQVSMSKREVRERFQADVLKPVLDFAEIWFQKFEEITFHDPLAAATLFDEQICVFERGTVEVELATKDEGLAGKTYWSPVRTGVMHEVATQMNKDKFFEHFFSVFS